jgi:hypothetical protein
MYRPKQYDLLCLFEVLEESLYRGVWTRGIASDISMLKRCVYYLNHSNLNMEPVLLIPVPKTPRKQTTRDDRLLCETLYSEAG